MLAQQLLQRKQYIPRRTQNRSRLVRHALRIRNLVVTQPLEKLFREVKAKGKIDLLRQQADGVWNGIHPDK